MPVSLQGFVKNRRHQFGRQSAFGTRVAAKRAYALKGVPDRNPNWTDPDVDVGSIDVVVAPHREAPSYTATLNFPQLHYNDVNLILSGFFGGTVSPTPAGLARIALYEPASTTVDDVDAFSYEFGDDVLTYWDQLSDGIIENFEITWPEGKGAATGSVTWRFGALHGSGFSDFQDSPTVPTTLTVEPNEVVVYGKDLGLYIASSAYDVNYSGALITDALHTATLRGNREIDEKRFLDGDQTFDVDAFATAARTIELEAQWAKTPDIVGEGSETDAWFSERAVDRYLRLFNESLEEADTGVPYSWDTTMPMRYYTSEHTDSGGNATETLTAKAFYDPVNSVPVFSSQVVNTLDAASL